MGVTMSLVETQELMATMREIISLLDAAEVKTGKVKSDITGEGGVAGASGMSLRREMHVMSMYMTAIQRFSGSDTLSQIANKIQDVSAAAMRFQMLLISIQTINTALSVGMAVTPWGWAALGANAIGLGISLSTLGQ
jgi:hypothetical protein